MRTARIEAARQQSAHRRAARGLDRRPGGVRGGPGHGAGAAVRAAGKERAAALGALERRIAFFVSQPGLLDSDAQLENAGRLLQDIQAAPPVGSRLRAAADKLEVMVQTAKTPVRVTIESDSLDRGVRVSRRQTRPFRHARAEPAAGDIHRGGIARRLPGRAPGARRQTGPGADPCYHHLQGQGLMAS
ncbi:MAG: hypothetical protein MZU95_00905 [Desulfomicrobium escambiense]|nr:hypothetical protein [Desulfomicrobium escambiense]